MARLSKQRFTDRKRNAQNCSLAALSIESYVVSISNALYVPQILIAVAVFIAYSNAMTGEFLFDDVGTIITNKSIQSVWPLNQSLWSPMDSSTAGRPIPNLTFSLNFAFGGLDVVSYHLTNVVLHILNAVLVFTLMNRTLRLTEWGKKNGNYVSIIALMTALGWGLHPMQTETVTYVTQRTELLMALFFLLTLYASSRAWEASHIARTGWQSLSILSCALGMASKEVMVVAPVMVVLYDWAFFGQSLGMLIKRRFSLYLGLFSTWSILAVLLATNPRAESAGFGLAIKPHEYLTTQFWAITNYLWLVLWPAQLCGDYGIFTITDFRLWLPSFILVVLLLGITLWAWFRYRGLAFMGVWFFLILSPTSSIVPIVTEPIAERRMYLPLLAPVTLILFGLFEVIRRWPKSKSYEETGMIVGRKLWALAVMLIVAGMLGFATHARNEVFQSELAFWKDVVDKRPNNARGHWTLGFVSLRENHLDAAIASFERFDELDPNDPEALYTLGSLHTTQSEKAIRYYDRAIEIRPHMFEAIFNRALLLHKLGRLDEAIAGYRSAIEFPTSSIGARTNLATIYLSRGELDNAAEEYRAILRTDPQMSDAYLNLGNISVRQGQHQKAIDWIAHALEIEPTNANAYRMIGDCHTSLRQHQKAIDAYRKCASLQPDNADSWISLGKAYVMDKQPIEAKKCYEYALQLRPGLSEAVSELNRLDGL